MKLAKSLNELKKNRWYRNLRVGFVLAFVAAQAMGFLLVRNRTQQEVITPISFKRVGGILTVEEPAYRDMSDEEAGRHIYRLHPDLWADAVEKYRKNYGIDPVATHREYSKAYETQFCVIAFLVITLFFEIIRRAFYFVIFGKVFPRKRRRRRRNEPESAETP